MKSLSFFLLILISIVSCTTDKERGIHIFLVGDSTMSDKPFKDGNPERGWGQVLPLFMIDDIVIENHAVNGRSTKSFRDEGKWDVVKVNIQSGDYVIIEFGHNDQKIKDPKRYADPDKDYRHNLTQYVQDVKEKGGNPVLATPIVRRRFDEQGEFYDTHGEYPGVVREVAKTTNVPLLDLHSLSRDLVIRYGEAESKKLFLHISPSEYDSFPEGKEDDTHLSATGAFRICDLVKSEIKKNIPALANSFKE